MQAVRIVDYPKGDYICPITGSKLIFQTPKECNDWDNWDSPRPRDSGFYYVSESNPNIGFKVSPFDYGKFWVDTELPFENLPSIYGPGAISREEHKKLWEEADNFSKSLKAFGKHKRVFIYDNGTWVENIFVAYKYLPTDSTEAEIEKVIKGYEDEYQQKLADSRKNPEKYPLGFGIRMEAKATAFDAVEVQPMTTPTGTLHYLDLKNTKN